MTTRAIHTLQCGDHVKEKEGRHIGRVRSYIAANGRALFARVEWLETRWISQGMDVADLEFASPDDY